MTTFMPGLMLLFWPTLHLMYGHSEHRVNRISAKRRGAGKALFAFYTLIALFAGETLFFYCLFALIAAALLFVQLRIWQPKMVTVLSALSLSVFVLSVAGVL